MVHLHILILKQFDKIQFQQFCKPQILSEMRKNATDYK